MLQAIASSLAHPAVGPILLSIFTLFSALVAILVSYYAFRFNRLVGSTLLRFIGLGFALVGTGLLVESLASAVIGTNAVQILGAPVRSEGLYLFFNIGIQVSAYFVFAIGYAVAAQGRSNRKTSGPAAVAAAVALPATSRLGQVVALNYYLFIFSQVVIVFFLAFIIIQGLFVFLSGRRIASLLVLVGFAFIFVAHLVMLDAGVYLSAQVYLIASAVQLMGFFSLLVFLIGSERLGST